MTHDRVLKVERLFWCLLHSRILSRIFDGSASPYDSWFIAALRPCPL